MLISSLQTRFVDVDGAAAPLLMYCSSNDLKTGGSQSPDLLQNLIEIYSILKNLNVFNIWK